jgi:hypothetical protein
MYYRAPYGACEVEGQWNLVVQVESVLERRAIRGYRLDVEVCVGRGDIHIRDL